MHESKNFVIGFFPDLVDRRNPSKHLDDITMVAASDYDKETQAALAKVPRKVWKVTCD